MIGADFMKYLAEINLLSNAGPFLTVMIGLIVIFGCVGLLLRVANDAKAFFGRTPPLDGDVRQIEARVARLEVAMERLATKDELDKKFQVLDAKRSRDTSDIHKHVESTSNNFNRRLQDVSESLAQDIGSMPQRIIDVIKNAQSIGRS
jgi:hypothetical protein